jgi:hypothetical protein
MVLIEVILNRFSKLMCSSSPNIQAIPHSYRMFKSYNLPIFLFLKAFVLILFNINLSFSYLHFALSIHHLDRHYLKKQFLLIFKMEMEEHALLFQIFILKKNSLRIGL